MKETGLSHEFLTDQASEVGDDNNGKHEVDVWAQPVVHATGCPPGKN